MRDGHIYHLDLRTRTCIHKGVDEGLNSTALCTNPEGTHFADGSDSEIVNIYNREEFLGGKGKPLKVIGNLFMDEEDQFEINTYPILYRIL